MTTAHRATWKAARGGLQEEGSFRLLVPSAAVSSKDAPTEANLKSRSNTDISEEELRDRSEAVGQPFRKRQRKSRFSSVSELKPADPSRVSSPSAPHLQSADQIHAAEQDEKTIHEQDEQTIHEQDEQTIHEQDEQTIHEQDEQTIHEQVQSDSIPQQNSTELGTHSDSESSAESDDDEAELLAELENIRKERAYERAKRRADKQTQNETEPSTNVAGTSPIHPNQRDGEFSETASVATGSVPGFAVQRRWNEDVVFRSDTTSERSKKQRFINDTIRNDYHRKFMKRHIK